MRDHFQLRSLLFRKKQKVVDILPVTETWFRDDDDWSVKECTPPGYKMVQVDREDRREGGVSLLARSCLNPFLIETYEVFDSFEYLICKLFKRCSCRISLSYSRRFQYPYG